MWGGELDLKECSNPEALAAVQMGHASKTEDLRWSPSRVQRADTELDPSRITKLIDKEFVWFDPQRGFCTDADNLKQSGIDKAFPYIFAAAMTAMSFGAGRENWGQIIISRLENSGAAHVGHASVQGLVQQATGGRFADGFINSALDSVAGEITSHLNGLNRGDGARGPARQRKQRAAPAHLVCCAR